MERILGTVKINNEQKFGFIITETTRESIFFPLSSCAGGYEPLNGDAVTFVKGINEREGKNKGKPMAKDVKLEKEAFRGSDKKAEIGNEFLNPYNFVQAEIQRNEEPFKKSPPQSHHVYSGLTGSISCQITAETPIISGKNEEGTISQYNKIGENYYINATSVKGMVRNIYESVTNSCFAIFDDRKLTQRMTTNDGKDLKPAIIGEGNQIICLEGLKGDNDKKNETALLLPTAHMLFYDKEGKKLHRSSSDNVTLNHGNEIWFVFTIEPHHNKDEINYYYCKIIEDGLWKTKEKAEEKMKAEAKDGKTYYCTKGYLFITNKNMSNKHDEKVFFGDENILCSNSKSIAAKAAIYSDGYEEAKAQYKNTVLEYKKIHEKEIKKDDSKVLMRMSGFIKREKSEILMKGDLVYAQIVDGTIKALYPVQMSRKEFSDTIGELLDESLHHCEDYNELCSACRLFGWVREKKGDDKKSAYAGKLSFSDAICSKYVKYEPVENGITLHELSSPKPTTTFFYLKQKNNNDNGFIKKANGYKKGKQELRGRKQYYHHNEFVLHAIKEDNPRSTKVKAVFNKGSVFDFSIDFMNLSEIEIGGLLWSLKLEDGMFHRLGYGKPLGFGSVKIENLNVKVLVNQTGREEWGTHHRYKTMNPYTLLKFNNDEMINNAITKFKEAYKKNYGIASFENHRVIKELRAILGNAKTYPIEYPSKTDTGTDKMKNSVLVIKNPPKESFKWFKACQTGLPFPTEDVTLKRN